MEMEKTNFVFREAVKLIPVKLSRKSVETLLNLIREAQETMSQVEFELSGSQWPVLMKKFGSDSKLELLRHPNHRRLVIELMKQGEMKLYNYSYFNRSKVDEEYLKYLEELGPYLFMEVVMVVNKLKVIHKYYYDELRNGIHEG